MVILDFNEMVNMTAEELETWLKGSKSKKAGWPKENNSGEAIGHESFFPRDPVLSHIRAILSRFIPHIS